MERNSEIIKTSVIGIVANVFLAGFKALVGVLSGSIAIIMDAVNNLSDVMSSVITIIGTKLSEKPADRMHPFGHGRIEYFSAIVISVIVLTTGVTSLVESVKKIIEPTAPNYTTVTLVVIVVAIVVKLILGRYVKKKGEELNSDSLVASGADALFDAVITLSTLVAAGIMLLWDVSVDGILGALISAAIIKSGVEMLKSPISELLGSRVAGDFVREVKKEVLSFDGVHGVFDVIMHTYGPDTIICSLHINVLDTTTASEIHMLDRYIAERLYQKFGIIATVGVYAINTGDNDASRMQNEIVKRVSSFEGVTSVHGFYVDFKRSVIAFDIIPEYEVRDVESLKNNLVESLKKDYPDFTFNIVVDNNYSEEIE
ncbi:MAG: cation transporter [Paludibacteraceae bacterium]|nr:cation transporter [Paludibacteraceae bacterium]